MKSYYLVVLSLLVADATAGYSGLRIDPSASWRVVGGSDAPDGLYPHQISLQAYGRHNCGGSIVASEWVITAAHCVLGSSPSSLKVAVGITKLSDGGTQYQVRKVYVHEKYDSNGLNDVAILNVDPITFNDRVAPIAVKKEEVGGNVPVVLSGWGSTILWGGTPDKLQHLNLRTTTVQECKNAHRDSGRPVEETQVCTLTEVGEGACHGDSGGPLIKEDENGARTLVGIVSWGRPCAKGYPDVFARAPSYVDWFNEKCNCL